MKKETKKNQVENKIKSLEVGENFNKKEFVVSVWGNSDYFINRSFDVFFNIAKNNLTDRKFKTEKGLIVRIK
jgi:hypothetical protein